VKRGRAVFPEAHHPTPQYRVRVGDQLLIGQEAVNISYNHEVGPDGCLSQGKAIRVKVEGLRLAEAQDVVQKALTSQGRSPAPIFLTLGGWTEEADPEVIDKLEAD
jgi:hypothetical protein